MSGLPDTNGVEEPRTQSEAEETLSGRPLTLDYRPSWGGNAFGGLGADGGDGGRFSDLWAHLRDIEWMIAHPCVIIPYRMYKSAIASIKFEMRADTEENAAFAYDVLKRIWGRHFGQLQLKCDYGWCGYEIDYDVEGGYVEFRNLIDLHPLDCFALTKRGEYRGFRLKGSMGGIAGANLRSGSVDLWGPGKWPSKGLWLAHDRRWDRWYGRSQLRGAWRPWRRLAGRDGAEDVIDGGVYRRAFQGPTIRYPEEAFKRKGGGEVDYEAARNEAMLMSQQLKAGSSMALSNARDQKGEYKWTIEWPSSALENFSSLLEYAKTLWDEISKGVGVPPELFEASETGSGYSGRMIPLQGFYETQVENCRSMVRSIVEQVINPMLRWNKGDDAWCEAEDVDIDLPELLKPEQVGAGGQPPSLAMPQQPMPGMQGEEDEQGFDEEEGDEEQQQSEEKWTRFSGKRGGRGWRKGKRVVYGKKPPGMGSLAQLLPGGGAEMSLADDESSDDPDWFDPGWYPEDDVDAWSVPVEGYSMAAPASASRYVQRQITRGPRKGQTGWYDGAGKKFMPANWSPRTQGQQQPAPAPAPKQPAKVSAGKPKAGVAAPPKPPANPKPPVARAPTAPKQTAPDVGFNEFFRADPGAYTDALHNKLYEAYSRGGVNAGASQDDPVLQAAKLLKDRAGVTLTQPELREFASQFSDAASKQAKADVLNRWAAKKKSPPAAPQQDPAKAQQMARIQAAAKKDFASPDHPIAKFKDKLATANFGSGEVRTLRATKDAPLSKQDHEAMDRAHSRTAAALKLTGNEQGAKAQLEAAQYHRQAAERKPDQQQQASQQSQESEHLRDIPAHVRKSVDQIHKAVAQSKDLNDSQRKEYFESASSVLKKLTPQAAQRYEKHLNKVNFAPSGRALGEQLAAALDQKLPGYGKAFRESGAVDDVGGCYARAGVNQLFLDGGMGHRRDVQAFRRDGSREDAMSGTRGIYAHEITHALDGPNLEISNSPEWKDAYQSEIVGEKGKPAPLTEYARTEPSEAFAEFGRLVLGDDQSLARARANYPKCFAIWQKHGLAPDSGVSMSAAAGQSPLPELFGKRVVFPGNLGHADLLRRPEPQQDRELSLSFTLAADDSPRTESSADDVLEDAASSARRLLREARQALLLALLRQPKELAPAVTRQWSAEWEPRLAEAFAAAGFAATLSGMASLAGLLTPDATDLPIPEWLDGEAASELPLAKSAAERLASMGLLSLPRYLAARGRAQSVGIVAAHEQTELIVGRVRSALSDAIEKGRTLEQFGRDVAGSLEGTALSPSNVETIFRTNVMAAYSDGQEQLLAEPEVGELFPFRAYFATHDGRVRPEHLAMETHGIQGTNIYLADDPVWQLYRPPWGHNCFLPGTVVQGRVELALKSWYSGEAVEITTRNGNRLSVTGNHPILTPHGFVAAGEIRKGQHLLSYKDRVENGDGSDGREELLATSARPPQARLASPFQDEQYEPAKIEEVFGSLADRSPSLLAPVRPDDLHGDARLGDGYVEVVGVNRELLLDTQAGRSDGVSDFCFASSDVSQSLVSGDGSLATGGDRVGVISPATPRRRALSLDSGAIALDVCPFGFLRFGLASQLDASIYETSGESAPSDTRLPTEFQEGLAAEISARQGRDLFGGERHPPRNIDPHTGLPEETRESSLRDVRLAKELVDRFPGSVAADEVVEVRKFAYSGHVYDLQSPFGWIVADGIFCSNCRCVWTAVSVAEAARRGIAYAQEWQRFGRKPANPPYVAMPAWKPDAQFAAARGVTLSAADDDSDVADLVMRLVEGVS